MAPPPPHSWAWGVDIFLQTSGLQWPTFPQWQRPQQLLDLAHVDEDRYTVTYKDATTRVPAHIKVITKDGRDHTVVPPILQAINLTPCVQIVKVGFMNRPSAIAGLEVANLRGVDVGPTEMKSRDGCDMEKPLVESVATFIPRSNLELLPMQGFPYASNQKNVELLRALEQNQTIVSLCAGGMYYPIAGDKAGEIHFDTSICDHPGWRFPCSSSFRRPFKGLERASEFPFQDSFDYWYYCTRVRAIAERNAKLAGRVRRGAFRVLSFARIILRATNPDPRQLPYEVVENIAACAAEGALSRRQLSRVLDHAADAEGTRRVAGILSSAARNGGEEQRIRLRDEWLHNGAIRWELGLEEARVQLGLERPKPVPSPVGRVTRAQAKAHAAQLDANPAVPDWPEPDDVEGMTDFLAFAPSPDSRWRHDYADVVREVVERYA